MIIVAIPVASATAFVAVSSRVRCAVLILEGRPRSEGQLRDRLRRLYTLTTAEADVVMRLAAGETPAQIAAARGTAIDTVRSQLKATLSKMGANRQAGLMALVSRLNY